MKLLDQRSATTTPTPCLAMWRSPAGRWTLVAEQTKGSGVFVSLLLLEPHWEIYGVLREWRFAHAARAQAFVERLRRQLAAVDEGVAPHVLLRRLPGRQAA